jgi:hypothetical protein
VWIRNILIHIFVGSGSFMAHVMEGVSLFRATPHLGIIPASGIIIPASSMVGDVPSVGGLPFASEISMSEVIRTQNFAAEEPVVDLVAAPEVHGNIESAVSDGAQTEGTSSPTTVAPTSGEHLDNIGEFGFPTSSLFVIACSTSLT